MIAREIRLTAVLAVRVWTEHLIVTLQHHQYRDFRPITLAMPVSTRRTNAPSLEEMLPRMAGVKSGHKGTNDFERCVMPTEEPRWKAHYELL